MNIVKKILRRVAFFLKGIVDNDIINSCYNQVNADKNVCFYVEAQVSNQQNDKSKITLKGGTHVRGMLLVFGFGGKITIGKDCYIGDHTRIYSGINIEIGNNVLISHGVNIFDNNSHELDAREREVGYKGLLKYGSVFLKDRIVCSPVIIKDNAWISMNSIILKGVVIGEGAIVAAGSVVTKDVPAWSVVAGNPAQVVKFLKKTEK